MTESHPPVHPDREGLVYDWNEVERREPARTGRFKLHDETLRDGIQSPSVVNPRIEDKLEILHLLDDIGIDTADVGLPGAGPRAFDDVLRLCREIAERGLGIQPTCAGRTVVGDIRPMAEVSQRVGLPIEVMTFIGSSPIRQLAEDWSPQLIVQRAVEAIDFATKEGLPVTFVTEDTTRSRPELLADLFRAAIDHGATRICLCDTVGHATPEGVRNLVRYTRHIIQSTGAECGIDWHGHNDRGLALINSLAAFDHGADRVHGCVLGIGERVGNAPLDLLVANLRLLGRLGSQDRDLGKLTTLCRKVSEATQTPIPRGYPVVGQDAFRTATGVHAAAIIKARRKGDDFLADRVYSGVPAGLFGRHQEIAIGPMSGLSNVTFWLEQHGYEPTQELVDRVLEAAKQAPRNLRDDEIEAIIARHRQPAVHST